MSEAFLTFREFNDIELAKDIGEFLKAEGIPYELEDNKYLFDVSFANNSVNPDVSLKLRGADFTRAQSILREYYQKAAESVEQDYYLFSCSNAELLEMLAKPDEWGEFDYCVAQWILKSRGQELSPELIGSLEEKRISQLSVPEPTNSDWVYRGYISAIFGGIFGIIFGYNLAYSKKTLLNGEQVYSYDEHNRKHGERIVRIGMVSFVFWIIVIIAFKLTAKR